MGELIIEVIVTTPYPTPRRVDRALKFAVIVALERIFPKTSGYGMEVQVR